MTDTVTIPEGMKQARLVIFESPHGRGEWKPLKPEDVPAWVKNPDVLGRIVSGEIAMDTAHGTNWYCAQQVPDDVAVARIFNAEVRRQKRAAKRRAH